MLKTKVAPKGDRMKWEPISSVKPVVVTRDMTVGRRLTAEDLRKNANNVTKFRIP